MRRRGGNGLRRTRGASASGVHHVLAGRVARDQDDRRLPGAALGRVEQAQPGGPRHHQVGHWLLLASLAYYVRPTAAMTTTRWLAPFVVVLALAGGIHPYLAVLSLLIAIAAIGRCALERRCGWGHAALLAGGLAAVTAGSTVLFGFAPGFDRESYAASGWGYFSLNLLAPINPMREGSLFLPAPAPGHRRAIRGIQLSRLRSHRTARGEPRACPAIAPLAWGLPGPAPRRAVGGLHRGALSSTITLGRTPSCTSRCPAR